MTAFKIPPSTECQGCGQPIGTTTLHDGSVVLNDFVTCHDGITSKVVTFHKHCHQRLTNPEPDLQRVHHITLAPVVFNASIKEIVG